MPDKTGQAAGGTAQPETPSLHRRAFILGTGAAAVGSLGPGVAAGGKRDDPDEETADRNRSAAGQKNHDAEPAMIAHRGFAGMYPENTVGAVEAASSGGRSSTAPSRGADLIEIDVLPTGDGDVVVFHDNRLAERDDGERGLTDTEGVVWETPTETVTKAKVLGTGETVPLLTEVMEATPAGTGVNVELKNPGSFDIEFAADLSGDELQAQIDTWRPFVEDVLRIVDEYNNEILFSSFYEAAIAVTRELSEYPVAPLLWDSIDRGLEIARTYEAEAVHPPYNMIKGTPFFKDQYFLPGDSFEDTDLLAVASEEGREVNVYTLATWYQAEQLAAAGVDGIIADYPGLLRFGAQTE